ncbi:MAG: hypothetical protein ABSB87_20210 [Terriglobales bacterium]|jgi:hypothetical protein
MRFWVAVTAMLAAMSVSGWAQQNNQFKVRVTHEKPAKQSPPMTKKAAGNTASGGDAKALQSIERESMKGSARSANKKAPALKPVKDKPNPPMNFNGTGGAKSAGRGVQSSSYKGRLKQKGGGGGGHQ